MLTIRLNLRSSGDISSGKLVSISRSSRNRARLWVLFPKHPQHPICYQEAAGDIDRGDQDRYRAEDDGQIQ